MSEWMSRVALETVGQTILGYSFDPLDSPYNNPYTSAVKELMLVQFPLIFNPSLTAFDAEYTNYQPDDLLSRPRPSVCAVPCTSWATCVQEEIGGVDAKCCCAEGEDDGGCDA